MTLQLKSVLRRVGHKQADLARALNVSNATVAQIINHGKWPTSIPNLPGRIRGFLGEAGATQADLLGVFHEEGEPCANTSRPVSPDEPDESNEEDAMLLRRQTLSQQAKKHFALFRNPFVDDVQSPEDMFVSPDIRYVREAMLQTARHGGFLAVVGESGAGKTVLSRDLEDRIAREAQPVILVKPYVLAMEDSDAKGKTLKATHIAEAIMAAVAPKESPRSSPEARFAQLHRALAASHTAGYRHCLLIDEAHSLPLPTIKHLKRFFELEMGFKKLLSIILVGQPELRTKLDARNAQVREVVQRCELVELAPLSGQALSDYLRHKFACLGKPLHEVIDGGGIEALRARLTFTNTQQDRRVATSLLYPLAIGNVVTAAMNLAAEVGAQTVTADVVKGV